jgi:hypothetical protein
MYALYSKQMLRVLVPLFPIGKLAMCFAVIWTLIQANDSIFENCSQHLIPWGHSTYTRHKRRVRFYLPCCSTDGALMAGRCSLAADDVI